MAQERLAEESLITELTTLPAPAERRIAVRVQPAAERALRGGHPWLFADSVTDQSHAGAAGDLAVIFDRKRRFLAIGLYDPHSPIRVRVLHHGTPATIDDGWFAAQIERAVALRAHLAASHPAGRETDGYRVVHGENDGLPGLVVDRYADTLVIKIYTAAWIPHLPPLIEALRAHLQPARAVLRMSRAVGSTGDRESAAPLQGLHDGQLLWGALPDEPLIFRENGLRFAVDPVHGQKTGFFLDQRDNRARVEALANGARVLNVFAYSGGFSLYAARGGAREVTSLDISQPALEDAVQNFALNREIPAVAAAQHHVLVGDAFSELAQLATAGQRFDVVVIDPPAFAKRQSEIEGALAAYAKLTRLGLGVVQSGGTMVLASCSSRIEDELFFRTVHSAATQAKFTLREIERTGHATDHPVGFAEGAYLKCLFATATPRLS